MKLLRPEIELTIDDLNALIVVLDSAIRGEGFAIHKIKTGVLPIEVEIEYSIREKPKDNTRFYSRTQVLREEWIPNEGGVPCFRIVGNNIINYGNRFLAMTLEHSRDGFVFAPTRELAEEIVKIRKGEWGPKEGDRVWFCGNGEPPVDKFLVIPKTYNNQVWRKHDDTQYIYIFPSEKQRSAFIEKNKPKEENIYIGKIPEYGFQKEIKLYADANGFLKIK